MGANGILMASFNGFFRLMATAAVWAFGSTAIIAAEIRNDPSRMGAAGAVLEGTIERGDFEKLRSFIFDGDGVPEIYLASPGGDLVEAMKIGHLVRTLKVTTVVPDKSLSADSRERLAIRHGLKDAKANYMCARRALPKFESYGTLETAAVCGRKAKTAIE